MKSSVNELKECINVISRNSESVDSRPYISLAMILERWKQYSNSYSSWSKYIFKRAVCDINQQKLDK